jgi:hypothetical protein
MPKSVGCGFDTANGGEIMTFDVNAPGTPNLAQIGVPALVDTGAAASFIDEALAQALQLPIVDRQKVSGSNGEHEVNMYLAQIHVPHLPFTQFGSFGGVHLAAGGQSHRALIGRTFLRHFVMTYNGLTGDVQLTLP